jgi:hypothetical protein
MDDNLLALEDEPARKLLEGEPGTPPSVDGVTLARATPVLADLRALFEQRSLLNDTLTQASELRKKVSRFLPSPHVHAELERLLLGSSIKVPEEQGSLAHRQLLSGVEHDATITPERLLAAMTNGYERCRDLIDDVESAWQHVDSEIDTAQRRLGDLQERGRALNLAPSEQFTTIRTTIDGLRLRAIRDPLGARADVTSTVTPAIDHLSADLDALAHERESASAHLVRAELLVRNLRDAYMRSVEQFDRRRAAIDDGPGYTTPPEPELVGGLLAWLETLRDAIQRSRWHGAYIGLGRWQAAATECLSSIRTAHAANSALLAARDDLLGRVDALRARYPALDRQAREAETLLRQTPTPLGRATKVVVDLEARARLAKS